jgi:hypothetical protein
MLALIPYMRARPIARGRLWAVAVTSIMLLVLTGFIAGIALFPWPLPGAQCPSFFFFVRTSQDVASI